MSTLVPEARFASAMSALSGIKPLAESTNSEPQPGAAAKLAAGSQPAFTFGVPSKPTFTFGDKRQTLGTGGRGGNTALAETQAKKKRGAEVPLHQLDEKNGMRLEDGDENEEPVDPRELEDNGRFGPPVEQGFGIKKADEATLANRKMIKRARRKKGGGSAGMQCDDGSPAPLKGLFSAKKPSTAAAFSAPAFSFNAGPTKAPFQSPAPKTAGVRIDPVDGGAADPPAFSFGALVAKPAKQHPTDQPPATKKPPTLSFGPPSAKPAEEEQSAAAKKPAAFTFNTGITTLPERKIAGFNFGAVSEKSSSEMPSFSFGKPASHPNTETAAPAAAAASTPALSFGAPKTAPGTAPEDEDAEEEQEEEPTVLLPGAGEEEEITEREHKAKLFKLADGELRAMLPLAISLSLIPNHSF